MAKLIKLNLYGILCLFLLLSFKAVKGAIDPIKIIAGTAKITGKLSGLKDKNMKDLYIHVTYSNPISGEQVKQKILVDQLGKFNADIKVETSLVMLGIYTSVNPGKSILVSAKNGDVTNIDIAYDSLFQFDHINVSPAMNKDDMMKGIEVVGKMIEFVPKRAPRRLYDQAPDQFLDHAKTSLTERLELLNNEPSFSEDLRDFLTKDFSLFLYTAHVFNYEAAMRANYMNTNDGRGNVPDLQNIDRNYYRFLKDLKLNDSRYLHTYTFSEFQNEILRNNKIGLPLIGDIDIQTWLASVKVILTDLLGFDNGQYYDILAANAYGRQLNDELEPLTEKQKKNIANYWKNGEIAKILLRKNQEVVELHQFKSPTVVNEISSVAKDKVMEAITTKYRGKVVLVDLWATWCSPCLDAINQFRSTKNEFKDKDVVFVYLTNRSSPKKLWEEKIKGIGNDHYYLDDAQWEYVMDQFGFEGIPSYVLYNKEGVLKDKFTGFPGNEQVKAMINNLL